MILSLSLLGMLLISKPVTLEVRLENKPIANQSVEVFAFKEEERLFQKEKKTDAKGRVILELDGKGEYNFIFRTVYQDIPYLSDIHSSQNFPKAVVISVYKAVKSDERVYIKDLRLFFSSDKQVVKVDEEVVVENESPFTITGTQTDHGFESLRIGLPAGTHDLMFGNGFEEKETRFDGNDIVSSHPLPPGTSRFVMRYAVERSAKSVDMVRKFNIPVRQISLASDIKGIRLSPLNFVRGADKFFADQMLPTFTAALSNQKDFNIFVTGLPLKYQVSQVLPFVGLFFLLLLLIPLIKKVPPEETGSTKMDLLKKMVLIKRLKDQDLIEETEFQKRRLKLLERLVPFYEAK